MTKETPFRTQSVCRCGRKSELLVGTRDFYIGTRKIQVNNLPHFYCSYCDSATYDSNTHVDKVLKEAYKNNLNQIDYP